LEQTAGAATRKIRNGKFRGGTTAAADVSLQACNWIPFQPLAHLAHLQPVAAGAIMSRGG